MKVNEETLNKIEKGKKWHFRVYRKMAKEGIANDYIFTFPDLCAALGVTRKTCQNWEKRGLLSCPKNSRGFRVFTLAQIKEIVKAFSPGGAGKWIFEG